MAFNFPGVVKLSILITSLKIRAHLLDRLLEILDKQTETDVEILTATDQGEKTIGAKRNLLISRAQGKYICFIDDDDRVSDNYVSLILKGIETKPDCMSLNGILAQAGRKDVIFKHSIEYKGWYEKDGILYRFPNHLNCIKTSIARKVPFPEINHGEDRNYSAALQRTGLLKKEFKIEPVIYYYDYIRKV